MLYARQRAQASARSAIQVIHGPCISQQTSRQLSVTARGQASQICAKSPYATTCRSRIQTSPVGLKNIQRRYLQSHHPPKGKTRFVYKIASAFSAKGHPFQKEKHHCQYDSDSGQHWWADRPIEAGKARARRHASGQDAFFVVGIGSTGSVAFGVADGVGGWADQGIDSAEFAHGLCDSMHHTAANHPGISEQAKLHLTPDVLLQTGYNIVCHDPKIAGGGSTACVAVADCDGVLTVANLGDSGFIHLRLNAVHNYSQPQTHAFNTPYQLSQVPPRVLAQIAKFGGKHPFQDMPANADTSSHKMRHGDILVFATDGVWDNLSSEDLLVTVASSMKASGAWLSATSGAINISGKLQELTRGSHHGSGEHFTLQTEIAQNIVNKAKAASHDTRRDGPFAKAARKAYPHEPRPWSGGKVDDICVVVAIVLSQTV